MHAGAGFAQPQAGSGRSAAGSSFRAGGTHDVYRGSGLIWFGDSLIAGFAVLAALMLGAALILPMILEMYSRSEDNAQRTASCLVLGRQPPAAVGLSLALMALLLALAVNVGVGTMVEI